MHCCHILFRKWLKDLSLIYSDYWRIKWSGENKMSSTWRPYVLNEATRLLICFQSIPRKISATEDPMEFPIVMTSVSLHDCPSKSKRMFSVHKRRKPLTYGTWISRVRSSVETHTSSLLFRLKEHWWKVSNNKQKIFSKDLLIRGLQNLVIQMCFW